VGDELLSKVATDAQGIFSILPEKKQNYFYLHLCCGDLWEQKTHTQRKKFLFYDRCTYSMYWCTFNSVSAWAGAPPNKGR